MALATDQRLLELAYPQIATELLDPLLDLLGSARHGFEGDLDKFLIVLAIGVRTTAHPMFRELRGEEVVKGAAPLLPNLGVNSQSVADSLNIPKESARRKILALIADGWLVRDEAGLLLLTEKAFRALVPLRRKLLQTVVKYGALMSKLRGGAH